MFHVEIVLDRARDAPALPAAIAQKNRLAGMRALVIDDLEINRIVLRARLESLGIDVQDAGSGADGLVMAAATAARGKAFDIVVTDHAMPWLGGVAVAAAIRAMQGGERVRIVLASSLGTGAPDDAGCQLFDAYLSKPMRNRDLVDCLSGLKDLPTSALTVVIPGSGPADNPAADVTGAGEANARILVVEDNAINRMLAEHLLAAAGYRIDMAESGAEAVEAASSGSFDLILNIQMPGMDGIEATRWIRALGGRQARVPIVALTAHAMAGDRAKFLEPGMNDHVTKPIRTAELLATMEKWLAAPPLPLPSRPQIDSGAATTLFDPEPLNALRPAMPPDRFAALTAAYADGMAKRLPAMRAQATDRNLAELARGAHDIKGTAGSFGACRLQALAEQLEAACAQTDIPACLAAMAAIGAAADETLARIRAQPVLNLAEMDA